MRKRGQKLSDLEKRLKYFKVNKEIRKDIYQSKIDNNKSIFLFIKNDNNNNLYIINKFNIKNVWEYKFPL